MSSDALDAPPITTLALILNPATRFPNTAVR